MFQTPLGGLEDLRILIDWCINNRKHIPMIVENKNHLPPPNDSSSAYTKHSVSLLRMIHQYFITDSVKYN